MMEVLKDNRTSLPQNPTGRYIFIGLLLSIIIVLAFYASNLFNAFQIPSLPQGTIAISQTSLEREYGLRVNLVAVTAAGGFVDVRLKIMDGEKLKLLLADKNNFPRLYSEKGVILNAPEDTKSQEIQYISGGNLFIMYPNSADAVKPGAPVTILFGNIALEPIDAK